jgi:predicted flap endonuclease-1-like 5' DNA nuclease
MQENEAEVEGIELMPFRVFWFVVAGFVLGFATSTLWEWLYYRGKRLQSLDRYSTTLLDVRRSHTAEPEEEDGRDAFDVDEWKLPAYRSSGVLLESEAGSGVSSFAGAVPLVKAPARPERSNDERLPAAAPAPHVDDQPSSDQKNGNQAATRNRSASPTVAVVTTPTQPADTAATDGAPVQPASTPARIHEHLSLAPHPQMVERTTPATEVPDEEESAGNAQAITRVTATAAATLGSMLSTPTPPEASPTSKSPVEATARVGPLAADAEMADAKQVPAFAAAQPARAAADHRTDRPTETTLRPPSQSSLRRPTDYPDDLAMIKGIGEAYKRRLYATGLYTWRQLAESDTDALRRITRAKPNADIESWQSQARTLAEKYQRMQANFNGPLDDFTRIEGIGAITADILYKAGICTYEHLAGTMPDELTLIVPAPTVGNENDFDGWINDAAHLAGAKRRNNSLLS